MVINLIGNVRDGKGLAADARMLRSVLPHEIHDVQYDAREAPAADLNLFLEVSAPWLHRFAPRNVAVPNPELWFEHDHARNEYDEIWAKTRHAATLMDFRITRYTGWSTEDLYLPEVEREDVVLHLAGGSRFRNTVEVIAAWREHWEPTLPRLRVYGLPIVRQMVGPIPKGVEWIEWADREDLIRDMNRCRYHLMPSQYEGYGVALWEGRSCDAIVVTTAAAPMNEGPAAALVPVQRYEPIRRRCLVEGAKVTPASIWYTMMRVFTAKDWTSNARSGWESERKSFIQRITEAIG